MTDWVQRNRAYKKKAGQWAASRPLPRLTVLSLCMDIMDRLTHHSLSVASVEWERKQELQAARGELRSYRVVQAAEQRDLCTYFSSMSKLMVVCPLALPPEARTLQARAILSRLASRSMCSLHQLLRLRRRGFPFKLFRLLASQAEDADDIQQNPYDGLEYSPCELDELSYNFMQFFPEFDSEARACLEGLATVIELVPPCFEIIMF